MQPARWLARGDSCLVLRRGRAAVVGGQLLARTRQQTVTMAGGVGGRGEGGASSRKRPRSESPDAQCSTPVPTAAGGETALDPGYHVARSKVLTCLWENNELSDVEVVVEGRRFPAHRVVLAAGSPHFRAMFTRTFSESRQSSIELHEMPADGFQGVLAFLYSGELALSDSNSEAVLLAADRCEVLGLVNICCNFMLGRTSWQNCLHYWSLADQVTVPPFCPAR